MLFRYTRIQSYVGYHFLVQTAESDGRFFFYSRIHAIIKSVFLLLLLVGVPPVRITTVCGMNRSDRTGVCVWLESACRACLEQTRWNKQFKEKVG